MPQSLRSKPKQTEFSDDWFKNCGIRNNKTPKQIEIGDEKMATDLTVILQNKPGTIADLGEALGAAGINIDGGCGFPCEGVGVMHILVEDGAAARSALEAQGFEIRDERNVLVIQGEDRPGELGEIARKIANAGINIDLLYPAFNNRLVLGVDDLDGTRSVLGLS